jgi:hypothetical protein
MVRAVRSTINAVRQSSKPSFKKASKTNKKAFKLAKKLNKIV